MPRLLVSLIASRLTWGVVIVSMLAGMIWLYGPLLEIHDSHPLAGGSARLLLIAALYVLFAVIGLSVKLWRGRRARSPAPAVEASAERASPQPSSTLDQGFDEATRLLRKAATARVPWYDPRGWWSRLNRRYLYQRPWYLLIGAPGSGKTTLLTRSGLHFPFADLFGQSAQRKVEATRDCDWWLTDAAVLLDTAGAYAGRQDPQGHGSGQWALLLKLLRQYRPRQPLDGVLLALGMDDLLGASADQRHEQARELHKRLQELHTRLRVRVPVYVVVTKADHLEGFAPYFAALDPSQRRQIWGFTLPYASTQAAGFDLGASFETQHGALLQRLEAGMPETLVATQEVDRRQSAYLLPQEFARLNGLLRGFLDTVFSFSSFESRIVPRGVYFTSGLQHGDGMAPGSAPATRQSELTDARRQAAEPENGQSGAYFIGDVFEKVVFQEAGLAESNRWWEFRHTALHWSGYTLLGAALLLVCALWLSSYRNNRAYLDEVALRLAPADAQGARLDPLQQQDLFKLLPYLNTLRDLPQSQQFALREPPLLYGLGLYQGKELELAGAGLYRRALDTLLKPLVASRIRDILEHDDGADPVFSYEAVKAYRMLFDAKHYDAGFLRAWLMSNLRHMHTADTTLIQWNELDAHLRALLDGNRFSAPFAEDPQLEDRSTRHLGDLPGAQRIYERLKQRLIASSARKSVSLVDLAGAPAELVFRRPSGRSRVDGIPALFTRDGYWQDFDRQLAGVARDMNDEDAWVIGRTAQAAGSQDVIDAVRQLYMQDYIAHWDGLLNDIALADISSLNQRIQTARLLSGPDSPMRRLLVNAVRNLQLTKDPQDPAADAAPQGASGANAGRPASVPQARLAAAEADSGDAVSQPEQIVVQHYRALLDLAQADGGAGGGIAFDSVLKQTGDLYNYLQTMQDAVNSGMSAPSSDVIASLQAQAARLPQPFQSMLRSLAVGANDDAQSSERGNLRKRVDAEVAGFCRRAIAGRYPLARDAAQDISAEDFGRMFAPGSGLMDSFFQQNLVTRVDTSRADWRFDSGADGRSVAGGERMLRPFQQAQTIRDTFFGRDAGRTPSFNVTLRPVSMDSDILSMSLVVDGQTLQYSHGPQVPQVVSWPGVNNSKRVGLQLNLFNGSSASLWTSGDWALHRLFDKATIANSAGARSRLATFNIDGHRVTLEIISNSVRDPLVPPPFTCS